MVELSQRLRYVLAEMGMGVTIPFVFDAGYLDQARELLNRIASPERIGDDGN